MPEPIDNEDLNEEESFDDLETENELKKIKLALEHGMDLSKPLAESGLPPEIESRFLDYVQQWEDEMAKGEMIKVFDLLGQPDWVPVNELSEEMVGNELQRILDLMHKNSLHIDTITSVGDRELYRFITEELFNKETQNVKVEGMMHCFIYEEYYPNHEHDIKSRCTGLVEHILNKTDQAEVAEGEDVHWGTTENILYRGKDYLRSDLNKRLKLFTDAFSSFTLNHLDFGALVIDDGKTIADVIAHINYTGVIDGSYETIDFDGECRFGLKREDDWWVIDSFEIPGVIV